MSALEPFRKLADPTSYRPCAWDLSVDSEGREHWVDFFPRYFATILKLGANAERARGDDPNEIAARCEAAQRELSQKFADFAENPTAHGRTTMLELDRWRDHTLRKHHFGDVFINLKERENEKMLPLLPTVCAQIDALPHADRFAALIEGIFAGNIFDMGAEATARAFLGASPDFFATRRSLAPRPWLIDDFDALAARVEAHVHDRAVFFIDNAGSDFLLGALPMIRWLARRGTNVVIAANDLPTLNDMTIHDVRRWWARIVEIESSFRDLPIELINTGTGDPLIDLSQVSRELNDASRDADLIILEGMGRGVESNLDARFTCDVLNIAMLKDKMIAKRTGGKVFDLVCQFHGAT